MKRFCLLQLMLLSIMVMAQSQRTTHDLRGRVMCEGRGVPGVVVTDGVDCVLTDEDGVYWLEGKRDVRHVYLSTPAGYLTACREKTIPQFYQSVDLTQPKESYNFELIKNKQDDTKHIFTVQTDVQATSMDDIRGYADFLKDMNAYLADYRGKREMFSIDCGDIVGDSPHLFPAYIDTVSALDLPIYRAIGNHDMTYGGRTFEYSYSKFEELFGPIYYSFNKGKAHYIVIDNCFYVNRNYQYIGYVDERTFRWLEQDLSYVPDDYLVFLIAHIPSSLSKKLPYNSFTLDETTNITALYKLLRKYQAHFISGHTHSNLNICLSDSLMEHNTAAVCGTWWRATICMDGTPAGYGVYEVNGNQVRWAYKSVGYPIEHQFRVYPVGSSHEYPQDIIANVWNWDDQWSVELWENGRSMGEMTHFTGYDPQAYAVCSDKERVLYDWISPHKTSHLFRATPQRAGSHLEVRVTDRFGRTYIQEVKK